MKFVEIKWNSADYHRLIKLRDRMLRIPLGLTFDPQDLQAESDHFHFAMVENDQIAACVVAVPLENGEAKIRQMCVDESFQSQGIGSQLMENVEQWLASRGYVRLILHARKEAIDFYLKLEYSPFGKPFEEVTIPHQAMEKRIG